MWRLVQFRLRTLLAMILILGAIGGWFVMHDAEHRRELKLIQDLLIDGPPSALQLTYCHDASSPPQVALIR